MFQSIFCVVPWGQWLVNSCFSDCYSHMKLWNVSPLGHQGEAISGHSQCPLCVLVCFDKAAEVCSGGAHLPASKRQ